MDVFAVGEVRGGFGVGLRVMGFGVHGRFVGRWGRVGGVGEGDLGGGVFGHVVGSGWLTGRLMLLIGLVDGGGFMEGGGRMGRGRGVVIAEDGRLDGILYCVSWRSVCLS